jgi:hypothetical protein
LPTLKKVKSKTLRIRKKVSAIFRCVKNERSIVHFFPFNQNISKNIRGSVNAISVENLTGLNKLTHELKTEIKTRPMRKLNIISSNVK